MVRCGIEVESFFKLKNEHGGIKYIPVEKILGSSAEYCSKHGVCADAHHVYACLFWPLQFMNISLLSARNYLKIVFDLFCVLVYVRVFGGQRPEY
jgi:hypothetical protein